MELWFYYPFVLVVSFIFRFGDSVLIVKKSFLSPYSSSSMALTFNAQVFNDGKGDDLSSVPARLEMVACCQFLNIAKTREDVFKAKNKECESMRTFSGLAYHVFKGQTQILRAFFPTKHVLNRHGACVFRIHGANSSIVGPITFDTVVRTTKASESKAQVCSTLDADPLNSCNPVNCLEKYGGFRSFYDKNVALCVPTPVCMEPIPSPLTLEALEDLDHKPSVVLDFENNKCLTQANPRKISIREVPNQTSTESVGQFAKSYGVSVTKLAAAIFLSGLALFIVCILLNLLCNFFCSCHTWLDERFWFRRTPPGCDKSKAKYSRINDGEENEMKCCVNDKVIDEVKERREMKRQSLQCYPQDSPPSRRPSRDPDNGADWEMRANHPSRSNHYNQSNYPDPEPHQDEEQNVTEQPGPSNGLRRSGETQRPPAAEDTVVAKASIRHQSDSSRKLPDINRLLSQFNELKYKKSLPHSDASRLDHQLTEAYGAPMHRFTENNRYTTPPTPQALWNTKAMVTVAHQAVQYETQPVPRPQANGSQVPDRRDTGIQSGVASKTMLPPVPPRISRSASNASSACSCKSVTKVAGAGPNCHGRSVISPPTSISNYNSSQENIQTVSIPFANRERPLIPSSSGGWIRTEDSIDRSYETEMTQAANFLRGLEQREYKKQMESSSPNERAKSDPSANFFNDQQIQKVETMANERTVPRSTKTIRRIKEEPPIPMSMIKADFLKSGSPLQASPSRGLVSMEKTQSNDSFKGSSTGYDPYPTTGSGLVSPEPLGVENSENVGSISDPKTGFGILKSSTSSRSSKAVKFQDVSTKPRSFVTQSPGELKRSSSDTIADRVETLRRHDLIDTDVLKGPNELLPSHTMLSTSESESAINSSSNASMSAFFDNDLVIGLNSFATSDEKLHQRRWIDAFVKEIT